MPTVGGDRVGGLAAVAGDHDRREPELVQCRDRRRRRRLDRVGDHERAAHDAAPPGVDRGAAVAGNGPLFGHRADVPRRDRRAPRRRRPSPPPLRRRGSRTRSAPRGRRRGRVHRRRPLVRSGARTRPRPTLRAGATPSPSVPGAGTTVATCMRPSVMVPVLSRTAASTTWVASSTSPPLITMPSCAPRPVPTMIAVGVARPSAQGQAMIRTATAAVNAWSAGLPSAQPDQQRDQRDHEHGRHEHRRDAVGQALHRRLRALRLLDQARDLRQRGVVADPGRLHDQPAGRVQRRAEHRVAGDDVDRHRLPGEHGDVDGRRRRRRRCRRSRSAHRAGRRTGRRPAGRPPGSRSPFSRRAVFAPSSRRARIASPDRRRARASNHFPRSSRVTIAAAVSK